MLASHRLMKTAAKYALVLVTAPDMKTSLPRHYPHPLWKIGPSTCVLDPLDYMSGPILRFMYDTFVHRISFWKSRPSVFHYMFVRRLRRFGRDSRSCERFRRGVGRAVVADSQPVIPGSDVVVHKDVVGQVKSVRHDHVHAVVE